MQTFLSYPDFAQSAAVLDRQRLGKQRVEVLQILGVLCGEKTGWANHPAVRMWRGYEMTLLSYGMAVCDEWTARGYRDTCKNKMIRLVFDFKGGGRHKVVMPPWMGKKKFHRSHQSNLYRKDSSYYALFEAVGAERAYIWPVP